MPLVLHLFTLMLVDSTMAAPQGMKTPDTPGNDINIFLTMAWQVAKHILPNSSCYVCGLMPYTAGEGLPLMALPASDCDTCHLLHIPLSQSYSHPDCARVSKMRPLNFSRGHTNCNRCLKTPKPVPILLIPQPSPWCPENVGETPVGRADCLRTLRWNQKHPGTVFKSLDSAPKNCVEAAGEARLSALAHHTASCSISSPAGMYWVCGNLAYPYLPVDYKGRCGLAYVVPAMRVSHSLPQKPALKRARRRVSDMFGTHHQSPFKNGVMSALDQISNLSHAVEVIANETGKALTLISSELASVRLLALQNRAALDFLLAARGGTCAVIGSECCTFVPDYNATIGEIVNHLYHTANSVHQDNSFLFDSFTNFGSLGYNIVHVFIFFGELSLLAVCLLCTHIKLSLMIPVCFCFCPRLLRAH